MSTPIRDGDGVDDPLIYAPRWARSSQPDRPALASYDHAPPTSPETKPGTTNALRAAAITKAAASITQAAIARAGKQRWIADAPSMVITDLPPMAPGIGGPNIELPPPRLRAFEGDIAIQELWRRLALNPEYLAAAAGAKTTRTDAPVDRQVCVSVAHGGNRCVRGHAAGEFAGGVRQLRVVADAALLDDPVTPATALQPAKMIVESQRAFANEPLPLGVWLNDASGGELLTMVGLATGTRLSAGAPLGARPAGRYRHEISAGVRVCAQGLCRSHGCSHRSALARSTRRQSSRQVGMGPQEGAAPGPAAGSQAACRCHHTQCAGSRSPHQARGGLRKGRRHRLGENCIAAGGQRGRRARLTCSCEDIRSGLSERTWSARIRLRMLRRPGNGTRKRCSSARPRRRVASNGSLPCSDLTCARVHGDAVGRVGCLPHWSCATSHTAKAGTSSHRRAMRRAPDRVPDVPNGWQRQSRAKVIQPPAQRPKRPIASSANFEHVGRWRQ